MKSTAGKYKNNVLLCWACNSFHLFERGTSKSKLQEKHKKFSNILYGWRGIDCPTGVSVYIEAFDPSETLQESSGRGGKNQGLE